MILSSRESAKSLSKRHQRPLRYRPHVYRYSFEQSKDLMEIVFAIINGEDIIDVDPQVFPDIVPLLKEKERQLKEWRNQPASRFIEKALEFISKYRYSDDISQYMINTSRSISKKNPSNEDIEFNVNLALNRNDFWSIDPQMYKLVIEKLKKMRINALESNNYLLAEKCENSVNRLISIQSDSRYQSICNSKADEIELKYQQSLEDFQKLKIEWETKLNNLLVENTEKIKQFELEQENELKEFEKIFKEDLPSEYKKFSSNILQLKRKEKYMVLAKRYKEATQINEELQKLEIIEKKEQKRKYSTELELKKKEFLNKQKEKLEIRKQNLNRIYQKLLIQSQIEIDHFEKSCEHLKNQIKLFDKESIKTLKNSKKINLFEENINSKSIGQLFRQRAKINSIVYTKTFK